MAAPSSPSGASGTRQSWPSPSSPAMPGPTRSSPSGCASLFGMVADEELGFASRAAQLAIFDRDHRFCGRCGRPAAPSPAEHARVCTGCGATAYPRLSPAVIVLVERGDACLLARSPRFPPGVYSAIAGFVEPGETAEHAVERELAEECGVSATGLRVLGIAALAVPPLADARLHRDVRGGRGPGRRGGGRGRGLVRRRCAAAPPAARLPRAAADRGVRRAGRDPGPSPPGTRVTQSAATLHPEGQEPSDLARRPAGPPGGLLPRGSARNPGASPAHRHGSARPCSTQGPVQMVPARSFQTITIALQRARQTRIRPYSSSGRSARTATASANTRTGPTIQFRPSESPRTFLSRKTPPRFSWWTFASG